LIVVAFCVAALLSPGELRAEKPTKTITGAVEKAEVYRGKVVSVYIKVSQGDRFLVVRSTETGKELLNHVGAKVQATGYVKDARPGSDFTKVIDVLSYEILPRGTH
jgi:hypothetical protein